MRILSISVGLAADLTVPYGDGDRIVRSAINKQPVSTLDNPQPVEVRALGLVGDDQVDQTVHGGLQQAVYVYPSEHLPIWQTIRKQAGIDAPMTPGLIGENLLIEGLREEFLYVGDQLLIGDVALAVTKPREPCFKFAARMGFAQAVKMMQQSGFTGWYCQVIRPGSLRAGDSITVAPGSRHVRLTDLRRKPGAR